MIRQWILGYIIFKQTLGEAAELAIKQSLSFAGPRLGADRRPSEAGHRMTLNDIDRCSHVFAMPC